MFLDDDDYRTVWQLAHDWTGQDSRNNASIDPAPETKQVIHRILIAIRSKLISVRTISSIIFEDDSFWFFVFDIPHYLKFKACLRKNRFDKKYLDSLYVWRPEVIRWCENDRHPIPPCWQPNAKTGVATHTESMPEIGDQTAHAPKNETTKGISKGEVINSFNDVYYDRDQWDKYLADPPEWLKPCRTVPGKKGSNRQSSLWSPVLIAAALLDKGITVNKLDAVFVGLPEWADEWREASDYFR